MNLFLSLSHRTLKFSPMTFHQAACDAPKSAAEGSGNALIPYLDRTLSDNLVLNQPKAGFRVGMDICSRLR